MRIGLRHNGTVTRAKPFFIGTTVARPAEMLVVTALRWTNFSLDGVKRRKSVVAGLEVTEVRLNVEKPAQ